MYVYKYLYKPYVPRNHANVSQQDMTYQRLHCPYDRDQSMNDFSNLFTKKCIYNGIRVYQKLWRTVAMYEKKNVNP